MATESRNNVQLSLKNLYRLLTAKDYPVYSTGILRRKNKKGLTLVRFWDEYLLYEWRNTVHGRLIWRTSGSRNRYHSEICNRRADFPLYEVYVQEVLDGLTAESFGKQLRLFEKFLTEREYDELVDYAISIGVENGFIQEGETASESFIPPFTNEGV